MTVLLCDLDAFSLSHVIALARTSSTTLDESGSSWHPCLVLDLKEKAFSFALLSDVNCELITYGLYYVEMCSLYTHLVENFITNRGRILSNAFCIF